MLTYVSKLEVYLLDKSDFVYANSEDWAFAARDLSI